MNSRPLPPNRRIRRASSPPETVVQAPAESVDTSGLEEAPRVVRTPRAVQRNASASIRERLQRLRAAAGVVFVIVASIAVAWGIRHHVLTSKRFAVRTVRVEGTYRRSPEQVVNTAGISVGMNIFALDLENARVRVLQDPWVETATVERKLPSTISIKITEREAAAAVAVGADLYLTTPGGQLFKRLEPTDPSDLVVITGVDPQQISTERDRVIGRVRMALDLLADYERKGPNRTHPAQEIHLSDDGTMRMIVGKSPVVVELGRPPYRKKVLRAARVLAEVTRRKANPAVVFLDNEAHPERVVVRMQ